MLSVLHPYNKDIGCHRCCYLFGTLAEFVLRLARSSSSMLVQSMINLFHLVKLTGCGSESFAFVALAQTRRNLGRARLARCMAMMAAMTMMIPSAILWHGGRLWVMFAFVCRFIWKWKENKIILPLLWASGLKRGTSNVMKCERVWIVIRNISEYLNYDLFDYW